MTPTAFRWGRAAALALAAAGATAGGPAPPAVDLSEHRDESGVQVRRQGERLEASWPAGSGDTARLALDLRPRRPLIAALEIGKGTAPPATVARGVDPQTFLTIGSRAAPGGRPPTHTIWDVFFDRPASRPHASHVSDLQPRAVRVASRGRRATVTLDGLTIGPFSGELRLTLYAGSPLVHAEAVVSTAEEGRAILYGAGLAGESAGWRRLAWTDPEGRPRDEVFDGGAPSRPLGVRGRALAVEAEGGSLACFPPPHQFFFPVDWTDNFRYAWAGRGHLGLAREAGFGIRQDPVQRGAFVPWFNAPPGAKHRLGVFYLLSRGGAAEALREAARFTNGDRFPALPGHLTFTSHWHMAIAVAAMQRQAAGADPGFVPEFVRVFKEMGVNAVHLAEFHGDGHQKDPGPLRLPELEAMFAECRRLSDAELLMIPGEEVNDFLGIREPGKHPGHWMSLFPKPVYWTMQRAAGQAPSEPHPRYGTVHRVGGRDDMLALLRREGGLAWTAHPRIKASSWTPDIFRREPFYRDDTWLGAAWKAMPGDLSRERLGERALDLLDDMANWGDRKYLPGEVDVFKIDRTHELYGHMNVNYLRLPRLPRFEQGWQPVLDALRKGRFFVSTGEVLIPEFTVGGRESGETLALPADGRPELRAALRWTFPLKFAEVISGDGERVYRERIDLADTQAFGRRALVLRPALAGRRWVRLEVWDAAANGAFTQPVWLASR